MRAVNLLPSDFKRGRGGGPGGLGGPGYAVIGILTLALALVTFYVVTSNAVSDQKTKLASLQRQLPQIQALAAQLNAYTQFASLAQSRAQTVSQIASGRFDWAASMDDLAKVVPANTSLQSLAATAGTGASSGGATASGGAGASGLRAALPNPAFELRGCTASQDDVARLMSRLRLMNGVVRVTLSTAGKQGSGTTATPAQSTPASTAAGGSGGAACPGSSFDLVVFFNGPATASPGSPTAPPGASPVAQQASTAAQSSSSSTPSSASPTAASTTTSAGATSGASSTSGSHR